MSSTRMSWLVEPGAHFKGAFGCWRSSTSSSTSESVESNGGATARAGKVWLRLTLDRRGALAMPRGEDMRGELGVPKI